MAPKKSKQSLAAFLADGTTGKVDWADDFEDLPSVPLNRPERTIPPRRGDDWLSSMPDRADRDRSMGGGAGGAPSVGFDRMSSIPPRDELPLPTNPPFTAFIGNLAFDLTESDVSDFFAPSATTSVRLVMGPDGRPKGFGYVEFETLDGLKDGLSRTGANLVNRPVRVSVAESRDAKSGGFGGPSAAEEASQWRRAGPLPPAEGSSRRPGGDRPGFGNRFESSGGGFDSMEVGAGGRSGFGSRFAASAPREDRPPRVVEPLEPSAGDNASDWRTGKPTTEPERRRPGASPAGEGARSSFRSRADASEADEKFQGLGAKFVATPPESPAASKRPGFGFDRKSAAGKDGLQGAPAGPGESADTWRSSASRQASEPSTSSPAETPAQPAQRKKLDLKPRSTPVADASASPQAAESAPSGKLNPFGGARPITTADREKEIEAKMAQKEKERKEEERKRKDKQKSDREKLNAPAEPRADRNKSRSTSNAKESKDAAPATKADGAAADVKTNGGSGKTPPTGPRKAAAAPPSGPKQPAPTGAWGAGRKPSGALVAENGAAESKADATPSNGDADAGVDKVTKETEAVSIQE